MSDSIIEPKKAKVNKDERGRNFATVFYPESQCPDLEARLAELHVPVLLSPLHDKDINATGEPKKPHRHCVLMFQGKKTEAQVKAMIEPLGAVGLEIVKDLRSYCRYLCHLDNPEKAQYNTGEVVALCGADYAEKIGTLSDKYKAIAEMEDFVEANNVLSYRQLCRYARENRDDWHRALADSCSRHMLEYIKSRFWELYKMQDEITAHFEKNGGEYNG